METFQAIAVTVLAVLPGALYTWSFEREVGNWGVGLSDRILRFVGFSSIFHAVLALPEWLLWTRYVHHVQGGRVSSPIAEGRAPGWLAIVPLAYVGIPIAVGALAAHAARFRRRWVRLLVGPRPQPLAWDRLFWDGPSFLVRLRMKNETWLGGLFGEHSYASGYPEPHDLLLETTYRMEPDGWFWSNEQGELDDVGSSVLVSWEDVDFLEAFPFPVEDEP